MIVNVPNDQYDKGLTREEVEDLACPDHTIREEFRDFINDTHDPVVLFGLHYDPASVLEEVDLIAFNTGLSDYTSEHYTETETDDHQPDQS